MQARGKHVRERTREAAMENLVTWTEDVAELHARHQHMRVIGSNPIETLYTLTASSVHFLCLLRGRVAPWLPRELWDQVVARVIVLPVPRDATLLRRFGCDGTAIWHCAALARG